MWYVMSIFRAMPSIKWIRLLLLFRNRVAFSITTQANIINNHSLSRLTCVCLQSYENMTNGYRYTYRICDECQPCVWWNWWKCSLCVCASECPWWTRSKRKSSKMNNDPQTISLDMNCIECKDTRDCEMSSTWQTMTTFIVICEFQLSLIRLIRSLSPANSAQLTKRFCIVANSSKRRWTFWFMISFIRNIQPQISTDIGSHIVVHLINGSGYSSVWKIMKNA